VAGARRRLRQKHYAAQDLAVQQSRGVQETYRLYLLHWPTYDTCYSHQCHNSFKWAVRDRLSPDVLKACYITIESLRNGLSELEKCARGWIREHVDFSDWHYEHATEFWTTMGLKGEVLDTLLRLHLRFEQGILYVATACEGSPTW
jgi:hypothetical protein